LFHSGFIRKRQPATRQAENKKEKILDPFLEWGNLSGMRNLALTFVLLVLAAIAWSSVWAEENRDIEPSAEGIQAVDETASNQLDKLVGGVLQKVHSGEGSVLPPEVAGVLHQEVFGFTVGQLGISFLILLFGLIFRNILSHAVLKHVARFAEKREDIDERIVYAFTKPLSAFLLLAAIYFSILVLPLDDAVHRFFSNLFRGATMLTVVWGVLIGSDVLADLLERRFGRGPQSPISGFAPLIKKTLKVFVLIVGVLMVIDNLGYNVTGIIATLGLGTAAVALAAQDTIKNAFGTLMIVLDRPFKVGDWIQVGDKVDGDVESIGLRSTKVRTWPKTLLSIPNGVLANEYVNNFSQMPKRRVRQVVGVSYEATGQDMEELVEDIRAILQADKDVNQEFILVNFTDFGESSLDILVYYFTTTVAWKDHMDIRQRINCQIMQAIRAKGLSIAFPTRSLYLDGPAASKMAGLPYESRWDSMPIEPGPEYPS